MLSGVVMAIQDDAYMYVWLLKTFQQVALRDAIGSWVSWSYCGSLRRATRACKWIAVPANNFDIVELTGHKGIPHKVLQIENKLQSIFGTQGAAIGGLDAH